MAAIELLPHYPLPADELIDQSVIDALDALFNQRGTEAGPDTLNLFLADFSAAGLDRSDVHGALYVCSAVTAALATKFPDNTTASARFDRIVSVLAKLDNAYALYVSTLPA